MIDCQVRTALYFGCFWYLVREGLKALGGVFSGLCLCITNSILLVIIF